MGIRLLDGEYASERDDARIMSLEASHYTRRTSCTYVRRWDRNAESATPIRPTLSRSFFEIISRDDAVHHSIYLLSKHSFRTVRERSDPKAVAAVLSGVVSAAVADATPSHACRIFDVTDVLGSCATSFGPDVLAHVPAPPVPHKPVYVRYDDFSDAGGTCLPRQTLLCRQTRDVLSFLDEPREKHVRVVCVIVADHPLYLSLLLGIVASAVVPRHTSLDKRLNVGTTTSRHFLRTTRKSDVHAHVSERMSTFFKRIPERMDNPYGASLTAEKRYRTYVGGMVASDLAPSQACYVRQSVEAFECLRNDAFFASVARAIDVDSPTSFSASYGVSDRRRMDDRLRFQDRRTTLLLRSMGQNHPRELLTPRPIKIVSVALSHVPKFSTTGSSCRPSFIVSHGNSGEILYSSMIHGIKRYRTNGIDKKKGLPVLFSLKENAPKFTDDVRLKFFHLSPGKSGVKMFSFRLNAMHVLEQLRMAEAKSDHHATSSRATHVALSFGVNDVDGASATDPRFSRGFRAYVVVALADAEPLDEDSPFFQVVDGVQDSERDASHEPTVDRVVLECTNPGCRRYGFVSDSFTVSIPSLVRKRRLGGSAENVPSSREEAAPNAESSGCLPPPTATVPQCFPFFNWSSSSDVRNTPKRTPATLVNKTNATFLSAKTIRGVVKCRRCGVLQNDWIPQLLLDEPEAETEAETAETETRQQALSSVAGVGADRWTAADAEATIAHRVCRVLEIYPMLDADVVERRVRSVVESTRDAEIADARISELVAGEFSTLNAVAESLAAQKALRPDESKALDAYGYEYVETPYGRGRVARVPPIRIAESNASVDVVPLPPTLAIDLDWGARLFVGNGDISVFPTAPVDSRKDAELAHELYEMDRAMRRAAIRAATSVASREAESLPQESTSTAPSPSFGRGYSMENVEEQFDRITAMLGLASMRAHSHSGSTGSAPLLSPSSSRSDDPASLTRPSSSRSTVFSRFGRRRRTQGPSGPRSQRDAEDVMPDDSPAFQQYDAVIQRILSRLATTDFATTIAVGGSTRRRATPDDIALLSEHSFEVAAAGEGRSEPCEICLDEYVSGDRVRTLGCFHRFHARCVDAWLLEAGTCPICRENINA